LVLQPQEEKPRSKLHVFANHKAMFEASCLLLFAANLLPNPAAAHSYDTAAIAKCVEHIAWQGPRFSAAAHRFQAADVITE
jgi:hypothetical protein